MKVSDLTTIQWKIEEYRKMQKLNRFVNNYRADPTWPNDLDNLIVQVLPFIDNNQKSTLFAEVKDLLTEKMKETYHWLRAHNIDEDELVEPSSDGVAPSRSPHAPKLDAFT